MEKDKILGLVLGILYYYLILKFFSLLWIFESIGGAISGFTGLLFFICFVILPIILLTMPLIVKFAFKKKFYEAILYSVLAVIIYIVILSIIGNCILLNFKTFSTEKWSNENWHRFRRDMVEDLEERYDLVGMTKDEVYSILGEEDVDLEMLINDYAIGYSVRNGFLEGYYYYIYLDKNDVVVRVELNYWE